MKVFLAALAMFMATPAAADFDAASYPPYERCALCHGLSGQSHSGKFPHLAGQKPGYILGQLEAFLSGHRANDGGQMASIVTELVPDDFAVVVAWFAEQDPPSPSDSPLVDKGAQLTKDAGCKTCHDGDASNDIPHLTAQHAVYIAKQMHDFREGRRTHNQGAEIHGSMMSNMDKDIDAIAAYLASLERPE